MRIAVTGSAGFIGKHLVKALQARGDLVFQYDKRDASALDLSRRNAFGIIAARQPELIVHLAGTSSTPGSVARPMETFDDTVITAANALEAAHVLDVPIIITSSVKARDGMTPYGAAKRMVELWALEYRAAFGFPVIINRPGTIYGPGQQGSLESGWIAWFLEAKWLGEPVVINGDGHQVRDLLHVSDYVTLLLRQIDEPEVFDTGEILDVGGGWDNAVSVLQVADYLGLKYTFGPPRYGDAKTYVALNDAPDWMPKTFWREGLDELVTAQARLDHGIFA